MAKIRVTDYWEDLPKQLTPKCQLWVKRINEGWRPNRRISSLGYHESAEFYGVYIAEFLQVISPLLEQNPSRASAADDAVIENAAGANQ